MNRPFSREFRQHYPSPTVTLDVVGQRSPLSQITGNTVLQDLRFELAFLPVGPNGKIRRITGDRQRLETFTALVLDYVQQQRHTPAIALGPSETAIAPLPTPQIQPQGLLRHQLHLGDFAPRGQDPILILKTTQLFDLSNVLEEHTHGTAVLPRLRPPRAPALLRWGPMAASILLVVGLGGGSWQYYQQRRTIPEASLEDMARTRIPNPPAILPPMPSEELAYDAIDPSVPPTFQTNPLTPPQALGSPGIAPPDLPETITVPAPSGLSPIPSDRQASPSFPLATLPPAAESPEAIAPSLEKANPTAEGLWGEGVAPVAANFGQDPAQIAQEVQQYLGRSWQAPQALNRTLEYRLQIRENGTLTRVIPLGITAQTYAPNLGLPAPGESFVSPSSAGEPMTIRVVIEEKAAIKTFLE